MLLALSAASIPAAELTPPAAFTTNCLACHTIDQAVVGPSLVEIAELYPERNRASFIKWCVEPGKKREHLPQMPAMVHVAEKDLHEIFNYIREVTKGVKRVRPSGADPYALSPGKTRRPRVERTFVPDSGPASIIVALPTARKHNVIWDTDSCRLRYISEGETDNWPYLRSNGNALAKVGEVCYVEHSPIFVAGKTQFKGCHLSDEGYPTFVYTVGGTTVTETISTAGGAIVRTIKASPRLPGFSLPRDQGDKLKIAAETAGDTLIIQHRIGSGT
ncbi:MAG: hypothetical protein JNK23_23370 [Opitutaceae bacterium]|nr:hypothetical protein [Opitutaceae bacterium]